MTRGSNDRQEAVASERRRRRSDTLSGTALRLSVNPDTLDRENFVYRFAKKNDARLHQLTRQDDWDIVTDRDGQVKADATPEGSEVSVHSGTSERGEAERLVLLRKPKKYADEDARAKQARIDEKEAGIRANKVQGLKDSEIYTPDGGGMRITSDR